MRGSDFAATYGPKGYAAWEAAALDLVTSGAQQVPSVVPVVLSDGQHTLVVAASEDVFAIGEGDDRLRLPLLPATAQRIADAWDMLLPTKLLSTAIGLPSRPGAPVPVQGPVLHLTPITAPELPSRRQNSGASMSQFLEHSQAIDRQLARLNYQGAGLVTGHKKDLVVGRIVRPGRVIIYGWFWSATDGSKDPFTVHGPYLTDNLKASQPIQPYSDAHHDQYVDYSHGVRLISRRAALDGQDVDLEEILKDPTYSYLATDEGPGQPTRYPLSGPAASAPARPRATAALDVRALPSSTGVARALGYADEGLFELALRKLSS